MTRATLAEVLQPALRQGHAVAGLVVLGWEDARAFTDAAEAERLPLILQAGPGCRAHTPLPVLAAMFHALADGADVPVVSHLDHGAGIDECHAALDLGFTSVMFDGSRLPFAENLAQTARIVALARRYGASVEAELGFVGYAAGAASTGTDPGEAAVFARDTGVDALAVSVGNTHLMQATTGSVDLPLLARLQAACPALPLVLHGGSGLAPSLRSQLARSTNVCKVNIGTELRQAFGAALRAALLRDPQGFDRIAILSETIPPLTRAARAALRSCNPGSALDP